MSRLIEPIVFLGIVLCGMVLFGMVLRGIGELNTVQRITFREF